MAWTTCNVCGLRFSNERPGCPRCGGGTLPGKPVPRRGWLWPTVLVVSAVVVWRLVMALEAGNSGGSWRAFWRGFFGA